MVGRARGEEVVQRGQPENTVAVVCEGGDVGEAHFADEESLFRWRDVRFGVSQDRLFGDRGGYSCWRGHDGIVLIW